MATFAARLEQNGVKVWLDQWHVKAGDSLTKFMESKIRSSGHVIVVCTPIYARKSNARQGGTGFEQQIISAHRLAGIPRRKILPVLRAGDHKPGRSCAIPTHLGSIYAVDARSKRFASSTLEELLPASFAQIKNYPLDRSDAQLVDAAEAVEEAIAKIEADNGYAANVPGERDYVVQSLKSFSATLKESAQITGMQIKTFAIDPLNAVIRRFTGAGLELVAAAAKDAILSWLKVKFGTLVTWLLF